MKKDNRTEKSAKIIYEACDARKLLRMGYTIIDIKPDKNNANKTLFIFKVEDNFLDDMKKVVFR